MKIPTVCEYCGGKVVLADASLVRGKSGERVYLCTNCNAYVGVHKGTAKPLGTLANTVLRMKRQEAHRAFDAIWKIQGLTRSEAYEWLSKELGLPKHRTHIGFFNVEQCDKAINVCRTYKIKEAA